MSQSAPGWYQDHDDPSLARWWDGERWTEHTLVLDEQDWSTEPDPPQTRFPDQTAVAPVVEDPSAGYEADIYAPIRDPWGDEPAAAAPAASSWDDGGDATQAWGGAVVGTDATWASGSTGWDNDYDDRSRAGAAQGLPQWAKVGLPLGVLAVLLIAFFAFGLSGDDDDPEVSTDSTTSTTTKASLGEAADLALETAGSGPFTRSTFTTLIPIACQAAESEDPATLTSRIQLLGYDSTAVGNLMNGLEAGAEAFCPDKMEEGGDVLDDVRAAVLTGATTSTSSTQVSVPDDGSTTSTSKKPRPTTTTTKKPNVTTTTSTPPPSSSTTTSEPPPSSTTSSSVPCSEENCE